MLFVDLVASTILVALTALAVGVGKGAPRACDFAASIATAILLLVLMPADFVLVENALAICLVALLFKLRPYRPWQFLASATAVTVLVYAVAGYRGVLYLQKARRLHAEFPFESMAKRLAYEQQWKTHSAGTEHSPRLGSAEAPEEFEDLRNSDAESARARALAGLHSSYVQQFIDAPGFGPARMRRPGNSLIELPEAPPIPLPPAPYVDPSKPELTELPKPVAPEHPLGDGDTTGFAASVRQFHRSSYLGFVNAVGFGYIRDRGHVAGFQAHQFREMPVFPASGDKQRWQVEALDLVSLLKHPEPVAYVSDHLPRMDDLRQAPVRALDAFETLALPDLEYGHDIDVSSGPEQIRMLGSIRAGRQCVRCHDVQRGELLGAFSYRLARQR